MLQKENNVQLDKNYERRNQTTDFSSYWEPEIHNEISQVKSRVAAKKIKSSDITMNADNSCFISGSGSEPYHVTLSSCQCQDFAVNKKRERPCKHIYRLASELGMFDLLPEKNPSGAASVQEEIQNDLEKWQREFLCGNISAEKYVKIADALSSK